MSFFLIAVSDRGFRELGESIIRSLQPHRKAFPILSKMLFKLLH